MDPNQAKLDQNQAVESQATGTLDGQVQPGQVTTGGLPDAGPKTEGTIPQPSQAVPLPSEPSMQATESAPFEPPKKGISKFTIVLIIILVAAVISTLVIYMAVFNKESPQQPVPVLIVPTATPKPLTDEEQLEGLDVGDIDEDLQEIDNDLQNL